MVEPRGRQEPRTQPIKNIIAATRRIFQQRRAQIGAGKSTPTNNRPPQLHRETTSRQGVHRGTPKREKHHRFGRHFDRHGHLHRGAEPARGSVPARRQKEIRPVHGGRHVSLQNFHGVQRRRIVHVLGRGHRSDQHNSVPAEAADQADGGGAEGDVGGGVVYGDGVRGRRLDHHPPP